MGFLNKLKELFNDVEEINEVNSEEELEEEKNELPNSGYCRWQPDGRRRKETWTRRNRN